MTAAEVSAAAASLGVISAIAFQVRSWKRATFSRAIEVMAQLDARWDGRELREARRRAAAYLRAPGRPDPQGFESAKAVVNFFETLGYLHGHGVIDADAVWHFFASWLIPYFEATVELRSRIAQGDPNVYGDFATVYAAVQAVERRKHPSHPSFHLLSEDAIRAFLLEEEGLALETLPATIPTPV